MKIGRRFKRDSEFHTCPRCGLKSIATAESCPECGLVFSRLALATNKDAKRKIRRNDKDFIIWTSQLPSDVNRLKLLLLSIFFGLFGCHCFYVGRYWRGGIILINTLAVIMYTIFNAQLVAIDDGKLIAALITLSGLIMILWAVDIIWIFMKRFKVPVAIDLQAESEDVTIENEGMEDSEIIVQTNIEDKEDLEKKEDSNEDSSRN